MPNWCCGILKIRGTKQDVVNFLTNGLIAINYEGNDVKKFKFYIDKYGNITYTSSKDLSCLYIEGIRRGFVYPDDCSCNYYNEEKDEVIVCLDAKFAWTIYTE